MIQTLIDELPEPERPRAADSIRCGPNFWLVPVEGQVGHWCERCLLPSRVRIRVFRLVELPSGPHVCLAGLVEYCDNEDQEPQWVTP